MSQALLPPVIGAATAMGCAVAGLIFLRHWRDTRDRLFAWFGAAFWVMAANRVALVAAGEEHEASTLIYLVRLGAFLLILAGIVEKNRSTRT
jgi:Fe2+ transport system protein B